MPLSIDAYITAARTEPWVRDFVGEWQLDHGSGAGGLDLAARLRQSVETNPDSALTLLLALADHAGDEQERVALAEEVECLLARHGATYWEVVDGLCRVLPNFRAVVADIWGSNLPTELREKVAAWRTS